jgi:hypothetical protein
MSMVLVLPQSLTGRESGTRLRVLDADYAFCIKINDLTSTFQQFSVSLRIRRTYDIALDPISALKKGSTPSRDAHGEYSEQLSVRRCFPIIGRVYPFTRAPSPDYHSRAKTLQRD